MFIEGYNTEVQCDSPPKLSIDFILENKEEHKQVMEELQRGNSYFELKSRQQDKTLITPLPENMKKELEKYTAYVNKRESKTEYKAEFMAEFMENNKEIIPHSVRLENSQYSDRLGISGTGMSGNLTLTDEEATLKVPLAGIEPDRVEIKKIDNVLRIRVQPDLTEEYNVITQKEPTASELKLFLTTEETIDSVEHELGMLTITIDRGRDVEEFNIG